MSICCALQYMLEGSEHHAFIHALYSYAYHPIHTSAAFLAALAILEQVAGEIIKLIFLLS